MQKNRYRKFVMLAVIAAMLMQIIGGALYVGAEGDETGGKDLGNIFTAVSLSVKQNGETEFEPVSDPARIDIDNNTQVSLNFDWELPDELQLADGDYAEIALPDMFDRGDLPDGAFSGDLIWGSENTVIGTYEITADNKLRVVFNHELTDLSERSGKVWLALKFNQNEFADDAIQTIAFSLSEEKAFTIISAPVGKDYIISKSGTTNKPINASFMNWSIDVNTTLSQLSDSSVVDTIPDGLEFDRESVEVFELTVGGDGTIKSEKLMDPQPDVVTVPEAGTVTSFSISFGETYRAYRVKYRTDITDYSLDGYNNKVVLRDGEEDKDSADFTIDKIEVGSLMEKNGVANNNGLNSDKITWTIDVNKAQQALSDVVITDSLGSAGLNIDNGSIKVYELNQSGGNWTIGNDVTDDYLADGADDIAFPVDLGNVDGQAYRIVFDTSVNYTEYHATNKFTNTAGIEVDGTERAADTAEVNVSRSSLLEKSGVEATSYAEPFIEWTVVVNAAGHTINKAKLADELSPGLDLVTNSVEVKDKFGQTVTILESDSESYPRWSSTGAPAGDGYELLLGDLGRDNSPYTITYKTKITDPTADFSSLTNTATLSGDGLNGDGIVDGNIEKTGYPTGEVTNKYFKETINQTVNEIAYDGVNYEAKTMSWRITVDAIKETITALTITDTFDPAGSMVFLPNTLVVLKDGSVIDNSYSVYTLTDNEIGGFGLTFNGSLERAKYEIYFKTSFDPNDVIDGGGTLNTTRSYVNEAAFTGTTVDTNNNEKQIDVSDNAEYWINQTIFNGGKKDGTLDRDNREITWKIYVNALGQDLSGKPYTITDTLSDGQVFDQESLKVYPYSLSKSGVINVENTPISADAYAVSWDDTNDEFTLTFDTGIDQPYMVEVKSKITGISKESYSNTAETASEGTIAKTYTGSVNYPNHDLFIVKSTSTITAYKDDQIDWTISVNDSLSQIAGGATITDTISSGLVLLTDSIVLKDSEANPVTAEGNYELTVEPGDDGTTVLTVTFAGMIENKYTLNYSTIVVGDNGSQISNSAKFVGEEVSGTTDGDKTFTVQSFSGGTGSGSRPGSIIITKIDAENSEHKLQGAGFEIYYLLNGDENQKYYVNNSSGSTTHYTDANGVLTVSGLPLRTYYIDEVEAPIGFVLPEVIEPVTATLVSGAITFETVINNAREKIDVTGTKQWVNGPETRPEIEIQLYRDGQALSEILGNAYGPVTLSDGQTSYTWEDLDKYDVANGEEYIYTVDEIAVPENYDKTIGEDGLTVINTYVVPKIDITANKTWLNGPETRPEIEIQLYRDGQALSDILGDDYGPVKLINGQTSYTWTGLDATDINGRDYVYTVDEVNVPENYEKSVDSLTITNSYVSPKTTFTFNKVWVNGPVTRPAIQVQLYRNGVAFGEPVVLKNGQTSYTWTNLNLNDRFGIPYTYTVDEVAVPENYSKTISEDGLTITNTYVIPKANITANKIWLGGSAPRPEIEIQLYRDGKALSEILGDDYGPVKLINGQTSYTWTGLDATDINGRLYVYTVDEVNVPEFYLKSINGLTITNTFIEPEEPSTINPILPEIPLVEQPPKNGTVEFDENGKWKYTPNPGFAGEDSFVIRHPDGTLETITVVVEDTPIAGPISVPKTGEQGGLPIIAGTMLILAAILFCIKQKFSRR
jgi:uncharacterized surface anchored protein